MSQITDNSIDKPKKQKKQKLYSAKKLPGLLKKKYSEKKLNKKIFKKLYVPEDKELLKALFIPAEPDNKGRIFYLIPKDKTFLKTELKRLKKIAKEIKNQKGRIKLVPLAAVAAFIFAVVTTVILFKNKIAKLAITTAVESVAEARCDIKNVDIKILKSTFTLDGLEIADKDAPMKNIIQIEKINLDFDLLQLLKARFVANDMSVLGVEFKTDRTYDGTLPPKKLKKIKKQKIEEEKKDSPLAASLKNKSDVALDGVKNTINSMMEQYNPQTYIDNFYKNLNTPQIAQEVQEEVEKLVSKYSDMPQKLEDEISQGQKIITEVEKINLDEISSNPLKIKEAVETLKNAYDYATKLQSDTNAIVKDIQKDTNYATKLSGNIQKSVQHDKKMLNTEISKITSFKLDDGKNIISSTIETLACQILGKYYPYAAKATKYLTAPKNNKAAKEQKAEKKKKTKRSEGRIITYKNDSAPKVWIKKISGSGGTMSFNFTDIASDMDITGKPAAGNFELTAAGIKHNAKLIIDTRTNSAEPLVYADYTCANIAIKFPSSQFGNIPGVPALDSSKGAVGCIFKLFEDEGFSISGKSILKEAKLSTVAFEPEILSDIYSNVLARIDTVDFTFTTGYTSSKGLTLNIDSEIDRQFIKALSDEISAQLKQLKEQIEKEALALINNLTNGALGEINSFDSLKKQILDYQNYANTLTKQVEGKKKEAENLMNKGIKDAEKKAQEELDRQKKEAEKKAKDEAVKALKNLF